MTLALRTLDKDVYRTEAHASCSTCELKKQCAQGQKCYAYVPEKFNGIMIVGEGPGHNEVLKKRPFIGRSGEILRGVLGAASIDMDQCFITNATLCKPMYSASDDKDKKGFMGSFPNAIYSCLPRLEEEIAAVRPDIIITLGTPALAALTGFEKTTLKRQPWAQYEEVVGSGQLGCPTCHEARKIGGIVECSAKKPDGTKCGFVTYWEDADEAFDADEPALLPRDIKTVEPSSEQLHRIRDTLCPGCGSKRKKCSPKQIKCHTCKGLKTYVVEEISFHHDYVVGKAAGACFDAAKLAAKLDELGVRWVIPTYHPAFLARQPHEDVKVMAGQYAANAVVRHLEQAKKLAEGAKLAYDTVEKKITTNPQDIYDYVLGPDAAPDWKADRIFELDIETESWWWNPDLKSGEGEWEPVPDKGTKDTGEANAWTVTEITCLGLHSPDRPYRLVVDTRSVDRHLAKVTCAQPIIDALIDVLQESPTPVSMQNGVYDSIVLRRIYGLHIANYVDDTMLSHHATCPDEAHNLAHQAHSYALLEPWKPPKRLKGLSQWKSYDQLCDYNARDLVHTQLVRNAHGVALGRAIPGGLLDREKVGQVYELDMQLARLALEMEWYGLPVNEQSIKKVGIEAIRKRDLARYELQVMLNEPTFDPVKPAQLQWALYDPNGPLKLIPPSKTGTGKGSTDKGSLARMAGEVPFVAKLIAFREANKIVTDFITGKGFPIYDDGRMHPSWRIWGARTGRWSSSPNFQNLPAWIRAVVEAAEGRAIVGADADQLELRGIGQLSGDEDLIRRCLEADPKRKLEPEHDPHSYLCSEVFGATYTNLLLDDPDHSDDKSKACRCQTCTRTALRTSGKSVFYAINYGGGPPTIVESIYKKGYEGPPITIELVARIIRTVYRLFPGVQRFREKLLADCTAMREVRSPLLKRKRDFPLGEIPPTEIYNYPLQSLGADLLAIVLLELAAELPKVDPTARIIAYVHDAIYVECAVAKQREVAALLTRLMTRDITTDNGITMPYTAKAKIGRNWKEVS